MSDFFIKIIRKEDLLNIANGFIILPFKKISTPIIIPIILQSLDTKNYAIIEPVSNGIKIFLNENIDFFFKRMRLMETFKIQLLDFTIDENSIKMILISHKGFELVEFNYHKLVTTIPKNISHQINILSQT